MLRPGLLAALLVTALLAGCSDTPQDTPDTPAAGEECTGDECAPAPLTAQSSVPAPTWAVGQWWEWEPADASGTGEPFRSVVLSTGPGGSVVATDDEGRAKQQAAFDHILIGAVSSSLAVTAWGGEWQLLEFPLASGKTWTATIPNIAWDVYGETVDLAMRAEFDADLPGFRFMGHEGDAMVLEGTYLPATGWFGELVVYDVDPGQDPLEFSFRATSAGLNHTGPVYSAVAEERLMLFDANGFTDVPTEGGQPIVQSPQPHGTFTLSEGTQLYGLILAVSVVGGRVVTLTDPANEQRQVVATGAPEGEQVLWLDEPSIAGQWTVATTGAGGLSAAQVEIYEVTVTETTL